MGKFRGHQDKSRRGREKKLLQKKLQKKPFSSPSSPNGIAKKPRPSDGPSVGGAGGKRKLKHVTYGKEHSVLICGDGDFSFTRGVIRHRGTGVGVVATSLDSRQGVIKKYPRAETWLPKLDQDGAQVVHSVDATRLEETLLRAMEKLADGESNGGQTGGADMKTQEDGGVDGAEGEGGRERPKKRVLFDRVVFNFPHTGKQRTHLNRNLIRDFFASTKGLVKCAAAGGEVHVTLKDKPPYSGWNVKAMAKESALVLVRTLAFDPSVFPGYRHSTTDPQAKEFDAGGARTNVFCRARSVEDDDVDESGAFPAIVRPSIVTVGKGDNTVSRANGDGSTAAAIAQSNGDDGEKENSLDSVGNSVAGLFEGGWGKGGGEWDNSGDEEDGVVGDGSDVDNWNGDSSNAVPAISNGNGSVDVAIHPGGEIGSQAAVNGGIASVSVGKAAGGGEGALNSGKKRKGKQKHPKQKSNGEDNEDGDVDEQQQQQQQQQDGDDEDDGAQSTGARGTLQPTLLKKKAAKRRALRKRKAAAAKEAAAKAANKEVEGAGTDVPVDAMALEETGDGGGEWTTIGGKANASKRKRGKYASATKRPKMDP